MTFCRVARYLRWHFEWHINIMAPRHPQMILGVCRDRMHEIKVFLDGFMIRRSQTVHPVLNPAFHPWEGHLDVTGIPQVNYSTSQQQLPSTPTEVSYLTKTPITTKPVVCTD